MRVVITGGSGFVGQWLARSLLASHHEVWAFSASARQARVLSADEDRALQWIRGDIRNADDVRRVLEASRPELIVHLAGLSFVPAADATPALAYEVNVLGAVNLLAAAAAVRDAGAPDPMVLIVGSGTQYGAHDASEMPLPETAAQRPASVYAATKSAQELASLQLAQSRSLRVVCTRSFSHSGRGHAPEFLLPALASRARKAKNEGTPLHIGNDVVRDYLHVDDVVRAYLLLAERGEPGQVYNVSSGTGVSVRELAQAALQAAGAPQRVQIVADPQLQRPSDMPVLVGANAKLREATGWQPIKSYRDIFEDLLAT